MERILVGLHFHEVALEAVYRAVYLADRIRAGVYLLLVADPGRELADSATFSDLNESIKCGLNRTLELAREAGVTVESYVVQGRYEEEVIRFVRQKGITLLVFGLPEADAKTTREFGRALRNIRNQVSCAIELVRPKEPLFDAGESGDRVDQ